MCRLWCSALYSRIRLYTYMCSIYTVHISGSTIPPVRVRLQLWQADENFYSVTTQESRVLSYWVLREDEVNVGLNIDPFTDSTVIWKMKSKQGLCFTVNMQWPMIDVDSEWQDVSVEVTMKEVTHVGSGWEMQTYVGFEAMTHTHTNTHTQTHKHTHTVLQSIRIHLPELHISDCIYLRSNFKRRNA